MVVVGVLGWFSLHFLGATILPLLLSKSSSVLNILPSTYLSRPMFKYGKLSTLFMQRAKCSGCRMRQTKTKFG